MAKISESGHSKNVANFNFLIAFVLGYGELYKPSKSSIAPAALQTVSANATSSIKAVNDFFSANSIAISARRVGFKPFSKLITRVINALASTDTSNEVDDQARTIVHKLQGTRATPKKTEEEKHLLEDEGKTVTEISSSQQSFDNLLANFDKLIRLLAGVSLYTPNEPELTVAGLTDHYNELKILNDKVVATFTQLSNARIARNEILYGETTGMTDLAFDVKLYIKSLFGSSSPQYKQVGGLKINPIKA